MSADLSAFGAITLDLQNANNSFPAGISISNIEVLTNFNTGTGNDVIVTRDNGAGPNNDSIITGDGNDTVTVVRGGDTVAMGEGTGDRLIVDFSGAVTDVQTYKSFGFGSPGPTTGRTVTPAIITPTAAPGTWSSPASSTSLSRPVAATTRSLPATATTFRHRHRRRYHRHAGGDDTITVGETAVRTR